MISIMKNVRYLTFSNRLPGCMDRAFTLQLLWGKLKHTRPVHDQAEQPVAFESAYRHALTHPCHLKTIMS